MAKTELGTRLEAFVAEHPNGWDHGSWLYLLSSLEADGLDVGDREAIGAALEQARLADVLKRASVRGLGPKRIHAVAERFRTLWNLQHATEDQVADLPTVPAKLSKEILAAVR